MDDTSKEIGSSRLKQLLKNVFANRISGLIISILLMILIFSLFSDNFFTYQNFINILFSSSIIGITAIGVSITILAGGLDLSIGSVIGLTGIISSQVFVMTGSPLLAFLMFIPIGLIVGFTNGILTIKLKIMDVVVTFAMLFALRGFTYLASNARRVSWPFDSWLDALGNLKIVSTPLPVFLFILIFLVFNFIIRNTTFGREVYALGGNKEAARVAGININRVKIITYIISAMLAAFSGIIYTSWMGSGQPNLGVGIEFKVLVGILLGGIFLSGGGGELLGTLVGVLFFNVLFNGLLFFGVSAYWQEVFTGIILVVVASYDSRRLIRASR